MVHNPTDLPRDPVTGYLQVDIKAGAGAGGTSSVDETAFVAGASAGTPLMASDPDSGELLIVETAPGTRSLSIAGSLTVTPVTSNTCSTNAPATVGAVSAVAIAANAGRKRLILQNLGTTNIYVLLGVGTASATNLTFILRAGGTMRDGSSPIYSDDMWQGEVNWISSAGGGLAVANELT